MRRQLVRLRGVIGMVFGATALLLKAPTAEEVMLLFAVYMLLDGGTALLSGLRAAGPQEAWRCFAAQGLLTCAVASVAFIWPAITLGYFIWILAAWATASGFFSIAAAVGWRRDHGKGWVQVASLVSTLWALLFAVFPATSAAQTTYWLGGYALAFGAAMLVLAHRLRRPASA